MTNPPDRPLSTSLASIRSLVERVPREPNTTGRYAARDPLDNFTNAVMPKVHDNHPTSLFQFIDLDLISEWELLVLRSIKRSNAGNLSPCIRLECHDAQPVPCIRG